jgi:hypothetical protein
MNPLRQIKSSIQGITLKYVDVCNVDLMIRYDMIKIIILINLTKALIAC